MTKAYAKALACSILASDAYHREAQGTGQDDDKCITDEDRERLSEAFRELSRELERRGRSSLAG